MHPSRRYSPAALLALALAPVALACNAALGEPEREEPAAPAPSSDETAVGAVPFDHVLHAGEYEIACLGCHSFADVGSVAGVPSVKKCMGCHKFVGKDLDGVKALTALFEQGRAPAWRRVYAVADYVYFSHRMHVRADVACAECHGDVAAMKTVERVSDLSMGWCMQCHRTRGASVDCLVCHK